MARVSKRKLAPQLEKRCFTLFWDYLANLRDSNAIKEFLESLLSYPEQVMLSKRLAIVLLLARGYSYNDIDKHLKVSKATAASIHRRILIGSPGFTNAARRILTKERRAAWWDELEKLLLKLSPPAAYGSGRWQRKHRIGRELAERKASREKL